MSSDASGTEKAVARLKIEDRENDAVQSVAESDAVHDALSVLANAVDESSEAVAAADEKTAVLEDRYINATWAHGNLMRGWDGYCRRVDRAPKSGNGSGTATGAPKQRKVRPSDRMFSMTSSTSSIRLESLGVDLAVRKSVNQKKKKKR